LSFSATDSIGFHDTLNLFRRHIISPAQQKAKIQFPLYSFWCPILAGPKKEFTRHNTYSTPPTLGFKSFPVSDDTLKKMYAVGSEAYQIAKDLFPMVHEWATSKQEPREENTAEPVETQEFEPQVPVETEEIPF